MDHRNVIIIGAGPTGLAVGLQLKREGINALVLERAKPGGLLKNANLIENYIGFPEGISGPDLADLMVRQARKSGVELVCDKVLSVNHDQKLFEIQTSSNQYTTSHIVVASGTSPIKLTKPDLPENCLASVFYEVFPMNDVRDSEIAIIGAGDAAFDYALNLCGNNRNNTVTILNRNAHPQALDLLQTRATDNACIKLSNQTILESVFLSSENRLSLELSVDAQETNLDVDYLLIAIGRTPRVDFLSGLTKNQIESLQTAGSLYLIGDVAGGRYRQCSIATGEGIKAAMKISQLMKDTHK